jgi:hypothetical protein
VWVYGGKLAGAHGRGHPKDERGLGFGRAAGDRRGIEFVVADDGACDLAAGELAEGWWQHPRRTARVRVLHAGLVSPGTKLLLEQVTIVAYGVQAEMVRLMTAPIEATSSMRPVVTIDQPGVGRSVVQMIFSPRTGTSSTTASASSFDSPPRTHSRGWLFCRTVRARFGRRPTVVRGFHARWADTALIEEGWSGTSIRQRVSGPGLFAPCRPLATGTEDERAIPWARGVQLTADPESIAEPNRTAVRALLGVAQLMVILDANDRDSCSTFGSAGTALLHRRPAIDNRCRLPRGLGPADIGREAERHVRGRTGPACQTGRVLDRAGCIW